MYKFSIVIPFCNAHKNICSCISSLVNQTYKNLEIIIADSTTDGSTFFNEPSTKDERIKIIRKPGSSVPCARNAGIDVATGDYIVFADSDSIFDNSIIEKCAAEISAHNPDLLVCAIKAPADDNHSRIYVDGNMYTRSEYMENIARYVSTGIGFNTVNNKIFRTDVIKLHNIHIDESLPLVAEELFNCRYFSIAGHIRCISDLLSNTDSIITDKCTTDYLNQGKIYSQALIDAVQSKGLYGVASQAIGENYQKILHRHLVLLSAPNDNCSISKRISALENLSQSSDYGILMMYLSTLRGIKNQYVYQMFKLRQWRLLINFLRK